jgi:hypothetical protein
MNLHIEHNVYFMLIMCCRRQTDAEETVIVQEEGDSGLQADIRAGLSRGMDQSCEELLVAATGGETGF